MAGFGQVEPRSRWDLLDLKQVMSALADATWPASGWNSLYLSNHDQPRSVSRFGDDGTYRVQSAKLLATFLHMLQGTPYVYQGEEIGMTNVRVRRRSTTTATSRPLNMYREFVGRARAGRRMRSWPMIHAQAAATTPARRCSGTTAPTPASPPARPGSGVNPNYAQINVAQALADPDSVFHYYRQLIRLRRENPVIVYGSYELILEDDPAIYAYTRTYADDRLLVILNFSPGQPTLTLPAEIPAAGHELLIGNYAAVETEGPGPMTLRPYEARVYRLG